MTIKYLSFVKTGVTFLFSFTVFAKADIFVYMVLIEVVVGLFLPALGLLCNVLEAEEALIKLGHDHVVLVRQLVCPEDAEPVELEGGDDVPVLVLQVPVVAEQRVRPQHRASLPAAAVVVPPGGRELRAQAELPLALRELHCRNTRCLSSC